MPTRKSLTVSLPESQAQFVRSQVKFGRFRTVSAVVQEGLRLLQEAEYRRLVEKWIYEDLTDEELAVLPEEVKARVQAYFQNLIAEAERSIEEHGLVDGPTAMAEIQVKLRAKYK